MIKHACAIIIMLCALRTYAEANNPFGTGTPPPTPPPNEQAFTDDDFLNPPPTPFSGDNSGGAQPAPTPQAATPSAPSTAQPAPTPSEPKNQTPSFSGKTIQPPPSAQKPQTTKRPSAPQLADYLELDSSVKGLEVKNFDLPNKDIKDVVTLISKWTGKNFILDNKVRGTITIIGPSQVTLQEAYQAFLSALDANNLTTVQSGKFIRIIDSGDARRAPVRTYTGDYAPKDDQFITSIFQLKYINADEVQREFRDLTTRQGKLFAYEPTNTIIVTDTGSNIQRLKDILRALDVKNFETTLHVLKIKNSSAKGISEMLGEIYGGQKGQTSGRNFRQMTMERTRGGGIITKIIPDELTNSLVVLANGAGFESLKQLVGRLDVKGTSGRIHVYYCSYAKSEDLAQTLSSVAGGGGGKKSSRAPGGPGGGGGAIGGGGPVAGGGGAVSADIGDAKVTSDGPTNSLVITASASDYRIGRAHV